MASHRAASSSSAALPPSSPSAPQRTTGDDFIATPAAADTLRSVLIAAGTGRPVLLSGPSGAGKTAFLRRAAELLGQEEPVFLFCDEQTDVKALLGTYVCGKVAGEFEWQPGIVTKALVEGRWVVLEDVDRVPAEILAALLPLADSRRLVLADRRRAIEAHSAFRLFGTLSSSSRTLASGKAAPREAEDEDVEMLDVKEEGAGRRVPLDFSTRVPATVAAWTRVCVAMPEEADMTAIICGLYPELTPICPQLLSSCRELQRATATVSGGWHLGSAAGLAGPREALRWCKRLARAKLVFLPHFTEQARLILLREALVALLGRVPDLARRRELLELLAPVWSLPRGMVGSLMEERPDISCGRGEAVIGNVVLPAKQASATDAGPPPFAYTSVHARVLQALGSSVRSDQPVLLVGDTGTGKTSVVQHLGHMLGQEVLVYNFSDQSESAELIGGFRPLDAIAKLMSELFVAFNSAFSQSFSKKKNAKLLERASAEYTKQRWPGFVQVVGSIAEQALRSVFDAAAAATKGFKGAQAASAWEVVLKLCKESSQALAQKAAPHFEFREGLLVSALRSGAWVVLDEINLAPGDILQRIQGLIERPGGSSIALPEAGNDRLVPHPNFRIFACMNPPVLPPAAAPRALGNGGETEQAKGTDVEMVASDPRPHSLGGSSPGVGKKELPPGIRARFVEAFVDEVQSPEDLELVVRSYLERDYPSPPAAAVVNFYLQAKALCGGCSLLDGAGRSVWFSLRNLTRALRFALRIVRRPFKPIPGLPALAQGLAVGFATPLDSTSAKVVENLIEKALGASTGIAPEHKRSSAAAEQKQAAEVQLDSSGAWVCVEGCWIKAGPLPVDIAAAHKDFVITPSVRRNLRNLARLLSGGRFPILLEGPTSSGKTSLVKFLASLTGHEFVRINNHEQTDLQEYVGQYVCDPTTGQLVFQEGVLVRAARAGHWVVLDELNLAPGEVLEALNRLLDDNRELYIPDTDTIVKPHEDFMVFATQNPAGGAYGGRKLLSRAFRNRFMEAFISELPMQELAAVLHHRCQMPPSYTKAMLAVYQDLQSHRCQTAVFLGRQSFMTVRDLLRWGYRKPVSQQELAFEGYALLAERLRKAEDREVVRLSIQKHCPGAKHLELDYTEDKLVKNLQERLEERKQRGEVPPGGVGDVIWTPSLCRLVALAGRCVQAGEPALIIGETGGGKTMACQVLSWLLVEAQLSQRLRILNCHQHTETADFIGSLQPVRGRDALLTAIRAEAATLLPIVRAEALAAGATDNGKLLERLSAQLQHAVQSDNGGDPGALAEVLRAALLRKVLSPATTEESSEHVAAPENEEGDHREAKRRRLDRSHESSGQAVTSARRLLAHCARWSRIFEWADGALVEAMRVGGAFLVDEISLAEDSVLERLNSVLEPERSLLLAEKPIIGAQLEIVKAADSFRLFATMNPGGDFGKRELSPALRNRFTEIWVEAIDFASPQAEALVLSRMPFRPLVKPLLRAVQWFNDRVLHPLSIREVLGWASFVTTATSKARDSVALHDASDPGSLSLAVEMYVHGGCMSLVDSLGLGNRMVDAEAFSAASAGADQDSNMAQLTRPQWVVLQHLLRQLEEEEIASALSDKARAALRGCFAEGGFAWLRTEGDEPLRQSGSDEGALQFGRFQVAKAAARQGAGEGGYNLNGTEAFDFSAPSTACNVGRLVRAMQEPRAILLEGPPGLGKTATVQALAHATGRQLVRINLSEQTDLLDLLGSDLPVPDSEGGVLFAWRDGALLNAIRNGDWVLLDEINLAPQATLEGLNALLDHRREVFLPAIGQTVAAGPGFRLFAAQNPVADGGGRKGLPRSFLNRFTRVVLAALSPADLLHICRHRYSDVVDSGHVSKAVELVEAIRARSSGQDGSARFEGHGDWDWNLRDALRLCELLRAGRPFRGNFAASAEMLFLSRLRTQADRETAAALIRRFSPELALPDPSGRPAASLRHAAGMLRQASASLPESLASEAGAVGTEAPLKAQCSIRYLPDGVQIGSAILRRSLPPEDLRVSIGAEHARRCLHLVPLPPQARALEVMAHAVATDLRWPVLLVGSTSSGKRSVVAWMAAAAGMPLKEVPLTPAMDASELLGCFEQVDVKGRILEFAGDARALADAMVRSMRSHGKVGQEEAGFPPNIQQCLGLCERLEATADDSAVNSVHAELLASLDRCLAVFREADASEKMRVAGAIFGEQLTALKARRFVASRFEWVDGPLVTAMMEGSWVLLSHVEHAAPAVLDRLNSVLEPNGFLLLTESGQERLIRPHPDFRVFFTVTNSSGSTSQQISRALRNRCIEVFVDAGPYQDPSSRPATMEQSRSPGFAVSAESLTFIRELPSQLLTQLESRAIAKDGPWQWTLAWVKAALVHASAPSGAGQELLPAVSPSTLQWACRLLGSAVQLHPSTMLLLACLHAFTVSVWTWLKTVLSGSAAGSVVSELAGPNGREAHRIWAQQLSHTFGDGLTWRSLHKFAALLTTSLKHFNAGAAATDTGTLTAEDMIMKHSEALRHSYLQTYVAEVSGGPPTEQLFSLILEVCCQLPLKGQQEQRQHSQLSFQRFAAATCMEMTRLRSLPQAEVDATRHLQLLQALVNNMVSPEESCWPLQLFLERAPPAQATWYLQILEQGPLASPWQRAAAAEFLSHPLVSRGLANACEALANHSLGLQHFRAGEIASGSFVWELSQWCLQVEAGAGSGVADAGCHLQGLLRSAQALLELSLVYHRAGSTRKEEATVAAAATPGSAWDLSVRFQVGNVPFSWLPHPILAVAEPLVKEVAAGIAAALSKASLEAIATSPMNLDSHLAEVRLALVLSRRLLQRLGSVSGARQQPHRQGGPSSLPPWSREETAVLCLVQQLHAVLMALAGVQELDSARSCFTRLRTHLMSAGNKWDPDGARRRATLLPLTDAVTAWGGLQPALKAPEEFILEQQLIELCKPPEAAKPSAAPGPALTADERWKAGDLAQLLAETVMRRELGNCRIERTAGILQAIRTKIAAAAPAAEAVQQVQQQRLLGSATALSTSINHGDMASSSAHRTFMVLLFVRAMWILLGKSQKASRSSESSFHTEADSAFIEHACSSAVRLLDLLPAGTLSAPMLVKAAAEVLGLELLLTPEKQERSEELLGMPQPATSTKPGGGEGGSMVEKRNLLAPHVFVRTLLAMRLHICDALEAGFSGDDNHKDAGIHSQLPFMLSPLTLSRHRPVWQPQVNAPAVASLVLQSGFKVAWALNQCTMASSLSTMATHGGHLHRLEVLLDACREEARAAASGLLAGDWLVLGQYLGQQFHGLALWSQQPAHKAVLARAAPMLAALGVQMAVTGAGAADRAESLRAFLPSLAELQQTLRECKQGLEDLEGTPLASGGQWPRPVSQLLQGLVIPMLEVLQRHVEKPVADQQDSVLRGALWVVASLWRLQSGGGALSLGGVEASEEAAQLRAELLNRVDELKEELKVRNMDRLIIDGVWDADGGPQVRDAAQELEHHTQEAEEMLRHCRLRPPMSLEGELAAFETLPAVAAMASDTAPTYQDLCQEVAAFATTVARPERILRLVEVLRSSFLGHNDDDAPMTAGGAETLAELHTVTIASLGFTQRLQARFPLHADLVGPVALAVHGLLHGLHLTQRHIWLSDGASGAAAAATVGPRQLGAVPQLPTAEPAGPSGPLGEDAQESHPEVVAWWLRWTGLQRLQVSQSLSAPRPKAALRLLEDFSRRQRAQEDEEATREAESRVPFRAAKVLAQLEEETEQDEGPELFPGADPEEMAKALGLAALDATQMGMAVPMEEEPADEGGGGGGLYDLWSKPASLSTAETHGSASMLAALGPGRAAASSVDIVLTDEQIAEICDLSLEAFETKAASALTEEEVASRRGEALDASLEMCIRQMVARPSRQHVQTRACLLSQATEAQLLPLAMVRLKNTITQLQPRKLLLDPDSIGQKRMAKQGFTKRLHTEAACAFYAECNPSVLLQLVAPLRTLLQRCQELLVRFEAHPCLTAIVSVIEKISQLRLLQATPMNAVTMLELLLGRVELWEANACREVSLAPQLQPLKGIVVHLRERQLLEWRRLCQVRQRHWERQGASWWCYLLATLADGVQNPRSLVDDLLRFIRVTPVVQFRLRLRMLQAASHLHLEAGGPQSMAGLIALHVCRYSMRWLPFTDKALKAKVDTTDKEIQELVSIVRWDLSNYHSLKESVSRSHRQLSKAIKKFDEALQELADPILAAASEQLEPPVAAAVMVAVGIPRLSSLLRIQLDPTPTTGIPSIEASTSTMKMTDTEEFWRHWPSVLAAVPTLFTSLTQRVAKTMIEDTFSFGAPEGCAPLDVANDLREDIRSVFEAVQDVDTAVSVKRRRLQGLRDELSCLGIISRPLAGDALDVMTFFRGETPARLGGKELLHERQPTDQPQEGEEQRMEVVGSSEDAAADAAGVDDEDTVERPAKRPRLDEWKDGPRTESGASFESRAGALWERSEVGMYECMHLALRLHSLKNKPNDLNSADRQLWLGLAAGCMQSLHWHRTRCVEFQGQLTKFAALCSVSLLGASALVQRKMLADLFTSVDQLLEGLLQAQLVSSSLDGADQASALNGAIAALRAVTATVLQTEEYKAHFGAMEASAEASSIRVRASFIANVQSGLREACEVARGVLQQAASAGQLPEAVTCRLEELRSTVVKQLDAIQATGNKSDGSSNVSGGSHDDDDAFREKSAASLRELLLYVQAAQRALPSDPSISITAANVTSNDGEATEIDWDGGELVPRLGVGRGDGLMTLLEVFPVDKLLHWLEKEMLALPRVSEEPLCAPFARQAVGIGQAVLLAGLEANTAMVDAAVNVLKLICLLLEKGLGTKGEEEEGGEDGQDGKTDWAAGTGMGEGDGVRDVTDEIEDDKQLEGMQNEKEQDKKEPPEMPKDGEEDKARDVGFDFDAEAQPQPEDEEKKQKDGEEQEEEQDLDRQKGDVDLNQGGKLDEKIWNGDEDKEEEEDGDDKNKEEEDNEKEKDKDEKGKENIEAHGAKGEGEADNKAKEEESKSKKDKNQPEDTNKDGEAEAREPAKDEGPVEPPPGVDPEEQEAQFDVHMQPQTPPQGEGEAGDQQNEEMDLDFDNLDGEGGGGEEGEDLPDPADGEGDAGEDEKDDENPENMDGAEDGAHEEGPPEAYPANDAGGEEPQPDQVDACVEGEAEQVEGEQEPPEEQAGAQGSTAQDQTEAEDGATCQADPESLSTGQDTQAQPAKDQQVFGGAGGAPTQTEAGQTEGRDSAQQQASKESRAAQGSEQGPKDLAAAPEPQQASGDKGERQRSQQQQEGEEGKEDSSQRQLKKVDVVQAEESGDMPCGDQEDSAAQKGLHMADPKSGTEALAESSEAPAGDNQATGAAEDQEDDEGEEARDPAMDEDVEMKKPENEKGLSSMALDLDPGATEPDRVLPAEKALPPEDQTLSASLGTPGANSTWVQLAQTQDEGEVGDAAAFEEADELLRERQRRSDAEVRQLWCQLEGATGPLAAALCEQLRAILEPTLKGRLQGHYRTGKRISMRRVIPFIASNYRRDKIWLRRTKPSKREYQVVVAIDNSRSMRECGVAPMALQTLCVVCQALARLEVGEYSVLAFGSERPRVLLPLGANQPHAATFGWEQAQPLLTEFTFDEESANSHNRSLAEVMCLAAQLFQERSGNGPVRPFCQAMLIISDGRFNKAKVRPWVHAALSRHQLPLLIIVDSVAGSEPAASVVAATAAPAAAVPAGAAVAASSEGSGAASSKSAGATVAQRQAPRSIFDLKAVSYEGGQCNVTPYLQDFPFPYYVVVQDLEALPNVLGEVLKQWFELAMGS